MKTLSLMIALASTAAFHTATRAEEAPSPVEKERAAIRAAADAFCSGLRNEPISGLPSAEQMRHLSPLVTPELTYLIELARSYQKEQARKYPDEKPYWIEGDLFSSSFEGVTAWELGEVFSAPTADATVKVKQTYSERGQDPVTWTDTLVFRQRDGRWLLDDVRMGAEWEFKTGSSLRGILPGGEWARENHESLDERWRVAFTREGDAVTEITVEPKDKSAPPAVLYGGDDGCPFPTWVVWSPECDMLAIRLGDGLRFNHTLIYRYASEKWVPVEMPKFYPEERATMISNGFRERQSLIDAERWQDANTLVVKYFGNFTKGDEGDGYYKFISVRIGAEGGAEIVGALDVPGGE